MHNLFDTAITVAESESDIRITRDTPYLALTDELWGVCCEDLGENRPRYNGTAWYMFMEANEEANEWTI